MKSWQIFYEARKCFKKDLCQVFGNRNSRTIDYWAQDPDFCADVKRNPLDRLGTLLNMLDDAGKRDVAVSALRILANEINCSVQDRKQVVPDKDTLNEEIIDDLPFFVNYQQALQGSDLEAVDRAEARLKREIAENRVKFIDEKIGDLGSSK